MRPVHPPVVVLRCAVGFGLLIALSACTAPPAPLGATDHDPTPSASLGVASASPSAAPSATSNPTFLRDPESAPWGVTIVPGESLVGNYTNYVYPVEIPRDGGPIRYAEGTTITEGSKVVAYRVASGDVYDFIARRFQLSNDGYLLILNEQRRGEAAPLYAGDVLNLSASTLQRYGTVNGRVADGPPPVTAPAQQR